MKILGGNQVVFYALPGEKPDEQLNDCLQQLEEYMDEHQIYPGSFIRHNIYVNLIEFSTYNTVKAKLMKLAKRPFPLPLLVNIITQAPVEGDLALESTYIQGPLWKCLHKESKYGACQLVKNNKVEMAIGSVQVSKYPDMKSCAEKAFEQMETLLEKCDMGMADVVKQWSYLERILDDDMMTQRYQSFNDVRTRYYDTDFEEGGYPASTAVGMATGGLIIEFMAIKNRNTHTAKIESPVQKAAYLYSSDVLSGEGAFDETLPTTPKLERGRSLKIGSKTMLFISATSAIIGERITADGDVKEQTLVALDNIKKLTDIINLKETGINAPNQGAFTLVKAYVQKQSEIDKVLEILVPLFKNIPLLIVQADLPRKEILVELEAEMML